MGYGRLSDVRPNQVIDPGAGCNAALTTTKGHPPISSAIDALNSRLDDLGKAITLLEERLGPILAPTPAVLDGTKPPHGSYGASPVACLIVQAEERVGGTVNRIHNLTERLEC